MERIYGELQNVIGKELLKHFSGKYEIIVDTYTVSVRLKGDIHQATVYNFKTKKYDIRNMERFKTVLERTLIDNDEAPEAKDIISDTNRVIDEIKGTMKEPDGLKLHTSIESKKYGRVELNIHYSKYAKIINWVDYNMVTGYTKEKTEKDISRICGKTNQHKVSNLLDHINRLEKVLSDYSLSVDYVIKLTINSGNDLTRQGVVVPLGDTDMLLVPQELYVSKTDLGSSVHLLDMGYRLVVENDGSNEYKVGVEDVTSGKILSYLLPTDTDEELKTKMRNAVIEGNKGYKELIDSINELNKQLNTTL